MKTLFALLVSLASLTGCAPYIVDKIHDRVPMPRGQAEAADAHLQEQISAVQERQLVQPDYAHLENRVSELEQNLIAIRRELDELIARPPGPPVKH